MVHKFDSLSFGDSTFLGSILQNDFYREIVELERVFFSNSNFIKFYISKKIKCQKVLISYEIEINNLLGILELSWDFDKEEFILKDSIDGCSVIKFADVIFNNKGMRLKKEKFSIMINASFSYSIYLIDSRKATLVRGI